MSQNIIFLSSGILLLALSGNYLVRSAVSIAQFFRVSTLMIGATIVSLGTSAPELIVSAGAAWKGQPTIAIGNVIGSNISNMGLVLGLTAIILPIPLKKFDIKWDWLIMFLSSILILIMMNTGKLISPVEGFIMIMVLLAYVAFSYFYTKGAYPKNDQVIRPPVWFGIKDISALLLRPVQLPFSLAVVVLIASNLGLFLGAKFLLEGATGIARHLGMSERIIGVSIIALGTSLPELATSLMAAIRKEIEISIGNIVGSNIFNIVGILGLTALIKPIPLSDARMNQDIIWMIALSILLLFLIIPFKYAQGVNQKIKMVGAFFKYKQLEHHSKISRIKGVLLFSIYTFYILWVFIL